MKSLSRSSIYRRLRQLRDRLATAEAAISRVDSAGFNAGNALTHFQTSIGETRREIWAWEARLG